MSPLPTEPPHSSATFLFEQWRTASLATIWRRPGDWHGPAAEAMADAMVSGIGREAAAALLGAQRASRGVGLNEGLEDLAVLFREAGNGEPSYAMTKSFASEWVEVSLASLRTIGCVDALTGLVTAEYFTARLAEVYAETRELPSGRCLVFLDVGLDRLGGWQSIMRRSVVGRTIRRVFDRGQTSAILPSGVFVTLAQRDDNLTESLIRLRRTLTTDDNQNEDPEQSLLLWTRPLPANLDLALSVLGEPTVTNGDLVSSPEA